MARADSCFGIIINPHELIKIFMQVPGNVHQRGSICGSETLIMKNSHWTLAAFCNRRDGYMKPLALDEIWHILKAHYEQQDNSDDDEEEKY